MDKITATVLIKEIRQKMYAITNPKLKEAKIIEIRDKRKKALEVPLAFITAGVFESRKDEDIHPIKVMWEALETAKDDIFSRFDFTKEELTRCADLFITAINNRIEEILRGEEADESKLQKLLKDIIYECRENFTLSGTNLELAQGRREFLVKEAVISLGDVAIPHNEFRELEADAKEYIFGNGEFYTLDELKTGHDLILKELKHRLQELVTAKEAELKKSSTAQEITAMVAAQKQVREEYQAELEKDKAEIEKKEAEQLKKWEPYSKLMTDAEQSGDTKTLEKLKALQSVVLGYDDYIVPLINEDVADKAG